MVKVFHCAGPLLINDVQQSNDRRKHMGCRCPPSRTRTPIKFAQFGLNILMLHTLCIKIHYDIPFSEHRNFLERGLNPSPFSIPPPLIRQTSIRHHEYRDTHWSLKALENEGGPSKSLKSDGICLVEFGIFLSNGHSID